MAKPSERRHDAHARPGSEVTKRLREVFCQNFQEAWSTSGYRNLRVFAEEIGIDYEHVRRYYYKGVARLGDAAETELQTIADAIGFQSIEEFWRLDTSIEPDTVADEITRRLPLERDLETKFEAIIRATETEHLPYLKKIIDGFYRETHTDVSDGPQS